MDPSSILGDSTIFNFIMYYFFRISLFYFCLILPFTGCDPKSENSKDQIANKTQKIISEKRVKKEIDFKLSDKNVMEFFLEYDKHNKENKVTNKILSLEK